MDAKTKKYLIIAAIVVAIILAIYYYGYKAGDKLKLPNNGGGIPQGWTAGKIVTDLKGLFSGWWDEVFNVNYSTVKGELANLTDDQLAAVANEYEHQTGNSLFDDANSYLSESDYLEFTTLFKNVL